MWLALPGQVLRFSLLRSEACGVAGHRVRRLLPIADMRVHAVVAAFQSKGKACEATTGVTGNRRERRGDRGCARRDEPRGGDEALAVSARRSVPMRGGGRGTRTLHALRRGGPRSDEMVLFSDSAVAVCLLLLLLLAAVAALLPPGEGAPKGRTPRRKHPWGVRVRQSEIARTTTH